MSASKNTTFSIRVSSTGDVFEVPPNRTILHVLYENGYEVPLDCSNGRCGTCRTRYLSGEVDHRDTALNESERSEYLTVCVSRAHGGEVVLDLPAPQSTQPVARPLAVVTDYHMVLPNVLATPAHKTRTVARQELGLSNDVFVVGVIGRLHYKKRPALAASAVACLRQTHDAELVFLGAGDCGLVENEAEWIHYAGQRADGASLIPAFDVVLHTGDVEAFGMVLLEAMAAGVPVAAGQFGGPQFVLGELGFYAQDDTPEGYAGAILAAAGADRAAWREAAIARWEGRFSLASTERRVSELARFLTDEKQAQA